MNITNLTINAIGILTLGSGIVAFFFLLFTQRHIEKNLRNPFRWMAVGLLFSFYSIVRIWAQNLISSGNFQTKLGPLLAGLVMIAIFIVQIIRVRKHELHHSTKGGLKIITSGVVLSILTLIFYSLYAIFPNWQIFLFFEGALIIAAHVSFAIGAFRIRSHYPGSGVEAIIFIGLLVSIFTTVIIVSFNQFSAENFAISGRTKIYQQLVGRQSQTHLSAESFVKGSIEGKKQLDSFLEEVNVDDTLRVNVVLPDGLIIDSDLPSQIGKQIKISTFSLDALKGTGSLQIVKSVGSMETPTDISSAVVLATLPLPIRDGDGMLGFTQIYFSGNDLRSVLFQIQSGIIMLALVQLLITIIVLFAVFFAFRRRIVHPMIELFDEVAHIHSAEKGHDTEVEHRRVTMQSTQMFNKLIEEINLLISELEDRKDQTKKDDLKEKWKLD